jgi:hypothetical protein
MRDFKKMSSNNNNRRSFHTVDREETPIAEAKNHVFVNNSKHLLRSPIEKLKSSLATSTSIVDALSMPSQDDVNKTFDSLLHSMATRKDDSSSSRNIKSIGRRKILSSSSRNTRNNDTLQDTDSNDDDDNDDDDAIAFGDDGSEHYHQHEDSFDEQRNISPHSYQSRSIRYNSNPTTPHNSEQSYSTTHPSSTRKHHQQQHSMTGSNHKKTMKSKLQMLESTYEPEIVNLRSKVEELSRRVAQQSSQVEKYRQELQIVREAKLSVNNSYMPGQS